MKKTTFKKSAMVILSIGLIWLLSSKLPLDKSPDLPPANSPSSKLPSTKSSQQSRVQQKSSKFEGVKYPSKDGFGYDNSFEVLLVAERGDAAAEQRLSETLARNPAEKEYLEAQAPMVHRRQLVRQTTTFREIADLLRSGSEIPTLALPDFDGGRILVELEKHTPLSDDVGTFIGRIKGDPLSLISLAFEEGSDAGEFYLTDQERRINFRPYDDSLVLMLEFDTVKLAEHLSHEHGESNPAFQEFNHGHEEANSNHHDDHDDQH